MGTEPSATTGTGDRLAAGDPGAAAGTTAGAAAAGELDPAPPVDARTRRRLDAVFGDALPAVTSDELGLDDPDRVRRTGPEADARLLDDRPPHHDRS